MPDLLIDADFPGGNIIVDALDGETALLRPDQRDGRTPWFTWAFRLRGAAGRVARVRFSGDRALGPLGPCASFDGRHWAWLGAASLRPDGFDCAIPPGCATAWFAFGIPYLAAHWQAFRRRRASGEVETLTHTEAGQPVELLRLPSARGTRTVLLTARHHACEAAANFVLEGVLAFRDSASRAGGYLREHVDLLAVPFVDLDGVARGDAGKNRQPHDHWEDYRSAPRYAAVRALTALPERLRGDFSLMLDLHCPYLTDDDLLLVAPPGAPAAAAARFRRLLAQHSAASLPYRQERYLPFGEAWNTIDTCCAGFFQRHARLALTVEVPYAQCGGVAVTPASARRFGRALGRAISQFCGEYA